MSELIGFIRGDIIQASRNIFMENSGYQRSIKGYAWNDVPIDNGFSNCAYPLDELRTADAVLHS